MRSVLLFVLLILLSTRAYCQSTYRRAVAKPGDGYQTLLLRHGLSPRLHLRQFQELNKKSLGRSKTLVVGRTYVLPHASSTPKRKPAARSTAAVPATSKKPIPSSQLFGGNYGAPRVRDRALGGAVYYLSSGHGGPDPGAIGTYGSSKLAEDEYAYDVTIRLARVLMEHGATVYMMVQDPNDGIRDEAILKTDHDEIGYPNQVIPLSQVYRLRKRIAEVNRLHARHQGAYQRLIALHVDSRSAGQNIDVFFYHHPGNALGLRLAKNIHKVFTTRYKRAQPNRPYSGNVSERGTLYEVRNSRAPAVFMELGNIRNSKDQRRFLVPDNRQALANWICEGLIVDYRGR